MPEKVIKKTLDVHVKNVFGKSYLLHIIYSW